MKILNSEKHLDAIMHSFKELITDQTSPDMLSETLDEILFKYTSYILMDRDAVGNLQPERNELYWLKTLRDLFIIKDL